MAERVLTMRYWGETSLRLAAKAFVAQWALFILPLFFLATNAILTSGIAQHGGATAFDVLSSLLEWSVPEGLFALFVFRLLQFALVIKPESPARALLADLRYLTIRPAWLINSLPAFCAMVLFNKAMLDMKPMIPLIHPFDWDTTLSALDRTLHFGIDPWRILQPVMGFPIVTFSVNLAYDFWFLALIGSWVWFCFQPSATELRTRYFLSYMLIWWLGGGLMAVVFSSAGPCYFGKLGLTPDPYAPLMDYLKSVDAKWHLLSIDTQDLLWDGYTGKSIPIGISAFPSMHNGNTMLFALAMRQLSPVLGRVALAYAALILVASVHLGWHYAVDGYAAIALALVSWWLCGIAARWLHKTPAMQAYNGKLATLA